MAEHLLDGDVKIESIKKNENKESLMFICFMLFIIFSILFVFFNTNYDEFNQKELNKNFTKINSNELIS